MDPMCPEAKSGQPDGVASSSPPSSPPVATVSIGDLNSLFQGICAELNILYHHWRDVHRQWYQVLREHGSCVTSTQSPQRELSIHARTLPHVETALFGRLQAIEQLIDHRQAELLSLGTLRAKLLLPYTHALGAMV